MNSSTPIRLIKQLGKCFLPFIKDAEHQLNLEISENETRKDFSKKERIDYARRLEKIESLRARERQATSIGGVNPQLSQNSDEAVNCRSDEIIATKLGIGSRDTYRKEKFITENQSLLPPADFADWDEGKLSTNIDWIDLSGRQT